MTVYTIRSSFLIVATALFLGCTGPASGPPAFELVHERLAGAVTERLVAGTYTYARLRLPAGDERWIVLSGRAHRGARALTATCYGRRRDFVSPRLGRTFPMLYFCSTTSATASAPTTSTATTEGVTP